MVRAGRGVKKRDGKSLTKEEIDYIVTAYTEGSIPDYQMSALLMAIFYVDMTDEEITNLTLAMANSGCVYRIPNGVFESPLFP